MFLCKEKSHIYIFYKLASSDPQRVDIYVVKTVVNQAQKSCLSFPSWIAHGSLCEKILFSFLGIGFLERTIRGHDPWRQSDMLRTWGDELAT